MLPAMCEIRHCIQFLDWLLKMYDVMVIQQNHKLIVPVKKDRSSNVKFYVSDSELFGVLNRTHMYLLDIWRRREND